jgi:hypothetical protein
LTIQSTGMSSVNVMTFISKINERNQSRKEGNKLKKEEIFAYKGPGVSAGKKTSGCYFELFTTHLSAKLTIQHF